MLDKIYEFAKENCKDIKSIDFKQKKIGGYICLDLNGNYERFEPIDNPILSSFPAIGNTGSSMTNIIIEKSDVVLGLHDSGKREEYYVNKINECSEYTPNLQPIVVFINNTRIDKSLATNIRDEINAIKIKSDLLSFKLNGNPIEQDAEIILAMQKAIPKSVDTIYGISSITNQEKELCSESVKFKFRSAGYDTPIAPFSKAKSAESYFQSGALISRIGQDEIEVIKSGFEKLLNDEKYYNPFFHMIHWYSGNNDNSIMNDDLFDFLAYYNADTNGEENEDDTHADEDEFIENGEANKVLNSIITIDDHNVGNIGNIIYHTAFCYAPCDSRYRLYGYKEWNVDSALDNLKSFKKDATIEWKGQILTIENLRYFLRLLAPSGTKDIEKFIKNNFGGNVDKLIYSVYDNTQIPSIFYRHAIAIASHFISIDNIKKSSNDRKYHLSQYLNAIKIIQLYTNRKELIMQNKNAYQCGRIFAVYEKIQKTVTDGNSVSSMFGVAKQYPSKIINKISSLSKHHLNSSKIKNSGLDFYYKKMLDELYKEMDEIPTKLSLDEQADFILGYHHQNNLLNTKKEKETNDNE